MAAMKRQVNDILDMWISGQSFTRIAQVTGLPIEMIEFIVDEYGDDVV